MTRAKVSKKHFEANQRHIRILEILAKGREPRSYLMGLGLSRSLKWLVDYGQATVTRTGNVDITPAGRERLAQWQKDVARSAE